MAEPQQHEGVAVPGRSVALFREGGEVGFVLDIHAGFGETFLEGCHQAPVPCGQAGGVTQLAGGRVDQPGGAYAHRMEPVRPRLLRDLFHQRHRLLHRGPGAHVAADRHRRLGEHGPDQVGHDHGDALGTHVQRRQMGAVGDDAVQLGVRPAPLCPGLADHRDESGVGEALDEVGDGRPGQAGQLLQLPCRQRALLLEQSEGEPVVDDPGGTRGCGHAGILPDQRGRTAGDRDVPLMTPIYQVGTLIVYARRQSEVGEEQ